MSEFHLFNFSLNILGLLMLTNLPEQDVALYSLLNELAHLIQLRVVSHVDLDFKGQLLLFLHDHRVDFLVDYLELTLHILLFSAGYWPELILLGDLVDILGHRQLATLLLTWLLFFFIFINELFDGLHRGEEHLVVGLLLSLAI